MRLGISVFLAGAAFGCGSETEPPAAPGVAPPAGCAAGQWQRDDGTCVPAGLPLDMPCPPGEWPREDGTCDPAGVPADGCGKGFVHDGDRGCNAVLPAAPCPNGLMAVPGDTECREVTPCAPGAWGDIPIEPDTEHVDASYAGMDSDGSAQKPWATIDDAIDAAADGAIVAIAAGSYVEDVVVGGKAVRLWGRCPELVEIVGTGVASAALRVVANADGTHVRSLAIRGAAGGVHSSGSTGVVLDRVWVHDNASRGVSVQEGSGSTSVTLTGALVEQNAEVGVFVLAADLTIEGSVVRETQPNAQGLHGRGVNAEAASASEPSTLSLSGSVVEQNRVYGVYVSGSHAVIEATVVRATQPTAVGLDGKGIVVQAHPQSGTSGTLALSTSIVEKNHDFGVWALASEATIVATVVRGTEPTADGIGGVGVAIGSDPSSGIPVTLSLRASLLDDNHDTGLYLTGTDASVEATVIRATQSDALGAFGRGIHANPARSGTPTSLSLRGSLVEQNREHGVFVLGSHASVEASVIRATRPDAQGGFGRGVNVQAGASLSMQASVVEESSDIGVFVQASQATVDSSVIRATRAEDGAAAARGVQAQAEDGGVGSTLSMHASVVEETHGVGILVIGSAATVDTSVVRATHFNGENSGRTSNGDGVVVWFERAPADATITSTRIDRTDRAAIAAYGARVALGTSQLTCQAFDIDGEVHDGSPAQLDDLGGNTCGCPDATAACLAVSSGLEPPVGVVTE